MSPSPPPLVATLWQLALKGDGFAVITEGGSVPKEEILLRAGELADALPKGGTGYRQALVAVATGSPLATVIAVFALSLSARPGVLVGSLRVPEALGVLHDLSPASVIYDTWTGKCFDPVVNAIELDGRTGVIKTRCYVRTTASSARIWPKEEGGQADRPFLAFRTSGTSATPKWVVHSEPTLWSSLDSKVRGMANYERDGDPSREQRETIRAVVGAPRAVFIPLGTISGYTQLVHAVALNVPYVTTADFLPRRALRLASGSRVGTIVVTPSMLQLMLTLPRVATMDWDRLGVIGIGGGFLRPELAVAAENAFGALVIQGYGSTELGGAVTNVRIYDDPEVRTHTAGRPLGGVNIEVHQPDGSKVASGEAGEIMVRAPERLALGYLGPAGAVSAIEPLELRDGFFPTGDIGAVRTDRNLVVLGRLSGRISRGDEDFYAEEVEAVLESHPQVVKALVAGEDRDGVVVIRATCEIVNGIYDIPASEIRAWCSERLPRARCPDLVDFATVPRTDTGKSRRH